MEGLITGRIVHYVLSDADVETIERSRLTASPGFSGNRTSPGDHVPAMVVNVLLDSPTGMANLTCFLDGHDTHWAASRQFDAEGKQLTWHWVERVDGD